MRPSEFKQAREALGLTQAQLADKLDRTRMSIYRYETGAWRIPAVVEMVLKQLTTQPGLPMVGIVAAGNPIEPVSQFELVDVPPSMLRGGQHFALRVKGESMRDEGIHPGDLVIIRKQATAQNGQTVVALVNNEATIKKYVAKGNRIELQPANPKMKPIVVSLNDNFRIEGVMIGLIRYCK